VEHRHGRAWPDLLRRRQQSVRLSAACRNAYAYTYRCCQRHGNTYGHSYVYAYANPNSNSNRTQPDANTITDFYTNSDSCTCRN